MSLQSFKSSLLWKKVQLIYKNLTFYCFFYTTSAIWFIEILPSIAFLHYSNCVFNWVDGQHAHALIGRIGKEKRELKTVHPCLGHLRFLYCIADTWFAIKNDNDTSVRAVVMLYVRIKTVLTLYHHFQHYKFMIREMFSPSVLPFMFNMYKTC